MVPSQGVLAPMTKCCFVALAAIRGARLLGTEMFSLASPKPLCSSQLSSARNLCAKEIETCLENKLFPLTFPLGRLGEAEPISCFMIKKELRTLLWKFNTTISYRNKMVHYLCSPKLFYSQLSKYLLTF